LYILGIALAQASAVALISIGLGIILRSTGVFVLETTIFGTAAALGLVTALFHQSSAAPPGEWFVASALIALALSVSLLFFYRLCRSARGGEATTMMMSFALMNALARTMTALTDGKSVNIGLNDPIMLALLGWGVILTLYWLSRKNDDKLVALKLARDNDTLLANFGLSGPKIRFITILGGSGLLAFGAVLYILQQENFAANKFEVYLIPAFAVAISRQRLDTFSMASMALCLVIVEKLLESWGALVLLRAYQSMILVALALIGPLGAALYKRYRSRSLLRKEIRINLSVLHPRGQ
jgi:hypothetical protein